MTVYELIQSLSRFDADTPVYINPLDGIHEGICKASDVESDRLANDQTEVVLIRMDDESCEETMSILYDKIEHGEFELLREPNPRPCSCGGVPDMLYNLETGRHGVACPKCLNWIPPAYFSKKDAIKAWNDMQEGRNYEKT